MASPSQHLNNQTNSRRLCRLLVKKGPQALRAAFDSFHPPSTLATSLNTNREILQKLGCIIRPQWGLLYPFSGLPDSQNFDVTLLIALLENICGLAKPERGWNALPSDSDTSPAANMARFKFYRKEIYARINITTELIDIEFEDLWLKNSRALISLGIPKSEVDELKKAPLSPEETEYFLLFEKWNIQRERNFYGLFRVGERAFGRLSLPDGYETLLKGLDWVESFEIVDENEECDTRHLEIVCKLGKVPRIADIVKCFGDEILHFITYQECERALDRLSLPDGYETLLKGLDWVESFEIVDENEECDTRHFEIVCKLGKVPRIADIVKCFGKEILPFITYQECERALDRLSLPDGYETLLKGLDWVESFEIVDENEECDTRHLEIVCKLGKVPRIADIVKCFGKEILPFITYQECERAFDRLSLPDGYETLLKGLDWVESFEIVDENEECDTRHLEIVCKLGKVPRITDIVKRFGKEILPLITYQECSKRKWFEANIFDENCGIEKEHEDSLRSLSWVLDYYVGVAREPDKSWQMYITYAENTTPSMVELKKLFGVDIAYFVDFIQGNKDRKEPRFLGPVSGDLLWVDQNDGRVSNGTIGILIAADNNHYATTCYHSCFKGDLNGGQQQKDEILKKDYEENARGCEGPCNYVAEQGQIRRLGDFHLGFYDGPHDIALIELDPVFNCANAVDLLNQLNIQALLGRQQVNKMLFDKEILAVEKYGSVTARTTGTFYGFGTADPINKDCYLIKRNDQQPFAEEGDSGSLVCIVDGKRRIPFAYVMRGVSEENKFYCQNLRYSLNKLNEDHRPCLAHCGFDQQAQN